jgi:hypothetical protein
MRGASVAVISENRHIVRTVTRALVSSGARVHSCGFSDEDVRSEATGHCDLILIDADHDPGTVSRTVIRVVDQGSDRKVLLLCRELSSTIADLIVDGELDHIVAKHGRIALARDLIDEAELIVTCDKLITGDIFGLERYLALPDVEIHEHQLDHSGRRQEMIEQLNGFLGAIDCYQGLRSTILTVADELLMNAIFSAPQDELGRPKYDSRRRTDRFPLEPHERVTLRYGCDGRSVLVSVSDMFGSLDRAMLLEYLSRGLRQEKGRLANKSTSAGLGLHLVLNSITQLVFNVEVGKRTEVIASFFVREGVRGFRSSGQSLNLFIERDSPSS